MKRFLTHHIPSRAIAFLVMATMGTIVFHSRATAQQPLAYWSFEDSLGVADSSAGGNFPINYLVANIRRGNTDPIVGQYLTLDDSLSSPGQLQLDDSLWLYREAASFECWIRPGKEFSFGELIGWGRLTIRLEESRMIVRYLDERGFPGRHFHTIPLQGVGRSDPNYLRDGNWHHIAATVNVKTGLIKLFIDGISPPGFSKNIGNGMRIYNSSSVFQFNTNGQEFIGDLDEVAVYDQEIAPELVWQHYQNGLNGQHYDFVLQPGQVPQLEPVAEAALNPLEFPPGYPFTPDTSLHLLMHYPSARFRPQDTILPRNLPWINDLRSVSNSTNAPQVNPFATLNSQQAAQIAQYLAQEYNYYLWLGPSANYNNPSFTTSSSQLGTQLIPIANSLPEIPRFVITNWNQLNKSLLFPGFGGGPFVKSSFLTDTFYVRNANLSVNNKNYWAWPAVTDNYRADTLRLDGRVQADVYLDSLLGQLTVKRVDLVGENGEVLYPRTVTTLNADPYISADRGSMPWDQYQSLRAFQFRETFSDVFLDHLDSVQPPGNSRPGLYWYNVSGNQGVSRFRYDSMRTINSEIEGRRRASSYYYPQSPARWRFNGNNILPDFQHIIDGRPREIALGDSMYLPGVSPGLNDGVYNAPDERRIRPGQFLGILKGHAMLGADAFNLFMFNSINNRFQGNWVTWETVIPPLAQAITGRANEFWYDGELMPGNPNVTLSGTYSTNDFIYSTGNLNSFVLARREYNSSRLLIMGTHQRTSNQQSSGWKSADVCIDLLPELQFNTRLQGSTYILDTTAAPPVFYQLDSWHEWKDPSHWCPHFAFEAEVFDNAPDSVSIRTERPSGVATWDFREFTSFLEFQQAPSSAIAPTYSFSPRDPVDSLRIWVKARNFDASPRDIVFDLDSGAVTRSIVVPADTTWQWYHLSGSTAQVFDNVPVGRHTITLIPADPDLEIDKFVLLTAAGNMGDTLQLAISGDTVCVGDTARFNPTGLIPGGCMDYTWDFGDGTAAYDTTAWKVYQFPGTYNVSLIATENCSGLSDTSFATVIVSAPLVDAGPDTTVCFGATLDLQGVANWPYKWRPDPSLDTIVVLDPTVTPPSSQYYYLETYDPASGCSAYDSVLVTMLQQNLEYQDTFVICDSASAQLQVLGAFNILWSPGNTLDDSTAFDPVATPDSTTTYTFWSWDACNCDTIQGTITVVVVDSPQVVAMADTTICEDDTLTLTASGLAVYTWGGPNNFNVNTNVGTVQVPPFNVSGSTGSVQRTYVVRGTMCGVTTRDTIVVTVGNAPELDTAWIVPRFQRFHCPGTTVGFTVSNPSSATFSWEPAAYLNNASLLEPTIVAEEDTTYILTVTGTNGCATNYNFPVQYGRIFGPDTVSFCPGGYVDLTVSNTLYHEWLPTAMFPSPYANTARIYPDSSMWVYNAIADIGGACPHLDSVYLLELVPPQILTPDTILCYGDTLTLQATGANEYLWFPTIGLSDSLVQNPLLTATQSEIYRVMNCEVPYCFAHDSVVITVDSFPLQPGVLFPDTSICHLDSVQLQAIPGQTSYLWSPTGTLSDSIAVAPMAGPLASTLYHVTIADSNGCSLTDSILVQVDSSAFPASFANQDSMICLGDTASLAVMGVGPNTVVTWTPNYNLVVVADTQALAFPAVDTTYLVTITDTVSGCTWSDSQRVYVNQLANGFAIVPGDTTLCYGDTVTFGVNVVAGSYSWSTTDTTATTTLTGLGSTQLILTAFDSLGNLVCQASDTIQVTVDSIPITGILLSGDSAICLGDSVQLFASGASQYLWTPGGSLNNNAISAPIAGPTSSTQYTVSMSNTGFCFVSDSLLVTVDSTGPSGTLAISDTIFCVGDTLALTASGGTFYTWTATAGGGLIAPTNGPSQQAAPSGPATFYVSVSDGGACQWGDSVMAVDTNCCDVPGSTLLINPLASAWAWPTSGGVFHVVDTFRVDTNIYFTNCTFWMDSAAVILVEIGDTLEVDKSEFLAACGGMWEGIVLEGSGSRLMSTGNLFEQAEHAVFATGGADFEITNDVFEANYIGVEVELSPTTTVYPGSVKTSSFSGGTMLPPHDNAFASFAGIKVTNVQGLTIGASGFDGDAYNTFEDLEHGVHIRRSAVTLWHNQFRDIRKDSSSTAFGSGAAIFANAAGPTTFGERLVVGLESGYGGQDLIDHGNVFDDCHYAVHARNSMDVFIRGNDMDSLGQYGVFVTRLVNDSLHIERNNIEQTEMAIYAGDIRGTDTKIYENVIFGDSLEQRHGIRFDQVYYPSLNAVDTVYPFDVSFNDIRVQGNGIWMVDVDHVSVQENYVFLKLPAGANPTTTLNGVYLAAASGPNRIITNDVRSYERTWETDSLVGVRGIYVESSPETSVNCNDVRDVGRSFEWRSFSDPSDMYKNLMINAVDGLALRDLGRIGTQGSSTVPADNRWQGSNFVNGQTLSHSSVGTDSRFLVRYSPVHYPTLNATAGSPQVAVDFDSIPSTSYDSVICTYRGTGIHILNSMLDIIQNRYGDGFYSNVTQFNADHWLIRSIVRDTTYISMEPEIEEFWNTYQDSAITLATKVMEAIAANDSSEAQSQLGSYAPMRVIEEYLEDVFEIEVDLISSDNGLDATAFETLQNLAELCPLEGGLAVHRARALLSIGEYPSWDYDDCASDSKARISNASPSSSSGGKLEIWPNPAYEVVNVRFLGQLSPGSKIQVIDGYGHVLTTREFDHISRGAVFQTDKWSDGLYSVRVIEPNGKSHIGKVLIIHQ